ncbi:MAG: S16 family serine protease, partial [bacterium]
MPVGGLKEKSLAAHRIGIKEIIIPEANKKDLDDIPKEILRDIKFIPLASVEQAIKYALEL